MDTDRIFYFGESVVLPAYRGQGGHRWRGGMEPCDRHQCGKEAWTYAEFDVAQLDDSRTSAQVANDRDWRGQLAPLVLQARVERA